MSVEIPEIEAPKPRKFIKQPDVESKNKKVAELNDKIKKIEASVTLLSAQIESTTTPKVDSEKRQALTASLRKLISSQDEIKKKRHLINDQIRLIDQNIKKKVAEITSKTSKYNFKTIEDIDKKIRKLESEIESGSLMLVEEKKALKEISSLNKLKKDFAGIELTQKSIDSDKAKIVELKSSLSALSNKDIQAKFEQTTKELDELSNKNKDVQTKRDELFNKRRSLQNEKYELLKQIRQIRDDFDAKFKKFKSDMDNERKKREEEEKAYKLYLERKDFKEEIAELEASKDSVVNEQVVQIKAAITALDPTYKFEDDVNPLDALNNLSLESNTAKSANEIELPENAEIIKKEEESFFVGTATKGKKKNNKKKQNKGVDNTIVTLLSLVDATIPESPEDYPKIIEELKEKLEVAKKDHEVENKAAQQKVDAKIAEIKEKITDLEKQILEELAKEKERKANKDKVVEESEEQETV
jgi:uncharacterized coiled-coil DUF342 family protein